MLGAGATVLGSGLAGCGSPVAAGLGGSELSPGTLTFWNLFGGGDGARLTVMLDNYAKQMGGPDSLQAATFAWGNPYYTKVSLATLGDKPPDVAVAHLTRAKNLARADLLTPITDDMLALVDLKPEDFNQKVWAGAEARRQELARSARHPPLCHVLQPQGVRARRPARLRRQADADRGRRCLERLR